MFTCIYLSEGGTTDGEVKGVRHFTWFVYTYNFSYPHFTIIIFVADFKGFIAMTFSPFLNMISTNSYIVVLM